MLHRGQPGAVKSTSRKHSARALLLAAPLALLIGASASVSGAAGSEPTGLRAPASGNGSVDIVQITGILDTAMLEQSLAGIREAPGRKASFLILQVDTPGAIVDVAPLLQAIRESSVPVGAWVGPSGATARGAGVEIVHAAGLSAISEGAHIGPLLPSRLDAESNALPASVKHEASNPLLAATMHKEIAGTTAIKRNLLDISAPTIAEFLARANGRSVPSSSGVVRLRVTQLVDAHGKPVTQTAGSGKGTKVAPADLVRFRGLALDRRLRHTLTVPEIFLLLLLAGLCLIVFEFFTAGVGLAGVAGAIGLLGAGIGLAELPIRWWALGLIVIGIFGFAVDVQAMIAKAWSTIGAVLVAVGSWFLIGGDDALQPSWWVVVVLVIGVVAFMLNGMSSMVRSRFSTPTIGRTSLIGEVGIAETAVDPDGVVIIRGARWKARTNRATPIAVGEEMRVAEIVGLILEVEPLEGAAKDHRESRSSEKTPETHM